MGLISLEHSNAVLKISSASVTSVSSVLLHKENISNHHFGYGLGQKNPTELSLASVFVMFNFDFIEGMFKKSLLCSTPVIQRLPSPPCV